MTYIVKYSVRGSYRINVKEFDTREEAEAFAERWENSNSIGSYVAKVEEVN
jgi:hypothetical protein